MMAVRYPHSLVAFVYRPETSKTCRMRGRVVIRTVIAVQRLSFVHLPDPDVLLQRFFRNHHMLLLHVILILLMKTVQSMDEFVLARMHQSTLRTMVRLMRILLLLVHELI